MDLVLTRSQLVRWRLAVFAIFLASGFTISTWAARVPAIKDLLRIDNLQIGLLFVGAGVGSIVGLSVSALILARLGGRRGMLAMGLIMGTGTLLIGVTAEVFRSYPAVLVALALFGFGGAALDVMMNVEGAAIEKQIGRTLLPVFHAFFSFGTVVGAGLGVVAAALHVGVLVHTLVIGLVVVAVILVSVANVPVREVAMDPAAQTPHRPWRERLHESLSAWREPRTYALGVVMLGMSFAEGGANDWLALGTAENHGGGAAVGAAALATFSVSMTVMRLLGGTLVDRFGRVVTLRVLSIAAAGGILLFILAPTLPLAFAGALLWGAGASLGFPLGMSAAADDPAKAAARVSAAATIGYVAFLCGPPLLGLVSEHIGLLNTLYILVFLAAASGFASSAARPIAGSTVGAGSR